MCKLRAADWALSSQAQLGVSLAWTRGAKRSGEESAPTPPGTSAWALPPPRTELSLRPCSLQGLWSGSDSTATSARGKGKGDSPGRQGFCQGEGSVTRPGFTQSRSLAEACSSQRFPESCVHTAAGTGAQAPGFYRPSWALHEEFWQSSTRITAWILSDPHGL